MTYYISPHKQMPRMARNMMRHVHDHGQNSDLRLSLNVQANEDDFILSAMVPGLKAEDLNIQVLENVVTIEGEFTEIEGDFQMQELPQGSFRRRLRLPTSVDSAKVEARIVDGILTLKMPKVESAKPRTIKVAAK